MTDRLDQGLLKELSELMEDDFPRLLETFLKDSENQRQAARAAFDGADLDRLRGYAHSLKGCSGNIGAASLSELCAQLEHVARRGQDERVPAILAALEAELTCVQREVSSLARRLA